MKAVGIYVGILRSDLGLSQDELAQKVHISEKTLRNLESGKHEPKVTKLEEIITLVRGSWLHVNQLIRSGTPELARQLANDVIAGKGFTEEQRTLLEGLTPEQKAALLSVARQMQQ